MGGVQTFPVGGLLLGRRAVGEWHWWHCGRAAVQAAARAVARRTRGCWRAASLVAAHGVALQPLAVVRVDVGIPSYRVPVPHPRRMLHILLTDVNERADTAASDLAHSPVDTTVMLVIDDPESPSVAAARGFEEDARFWGRVRVRVLPRNMGASAARNRCLDESSADYMLFLDDDVVPGQGMLTEAGRLVRAHPHAAGFVGPTQLGPGFPTVQTAAMALSYLSFFWALAARLFALALPSLFPVRGAPPPSLS